jgi:hypothetical protein
MRLMPSAALCCILLCSVTGPVAADEALLLVSSQGKYFVTRAAGSELHEVAATTSRATFGESAKLFAMLTLRDRDTSTLQLYDKQTLRAVGSWEVPGQPASQLSGGSRDVVVTERSAYLVTIRYTADGPRTGPQTTPFDFHRITLTDGSMQTSQLPRACANPRLTDVQGVPYLYSWGGDNVWRFDESAGKFVQVVSKDDVDESFTTTGSTIPQPSMPNYSDYKVMPDGAIFRLSRQGTVRQVLQSDMRPMPEAGRELSLASRGKVVRLYAAALSDGQALGVLQQLPGEMLFTLSDAASKGLLWKRKLPQSVDPDSLFISRDGSLYYIDSASLTVLKASGERVEPLWKLNGVAKQISGYGNRIVWATPTDGTQVN